MRFVQQPPMKCQSIVSPADNVFVPRYSDCSHQIHPAMNVLQSLPDIPEIKTVW